MKQFLKEVRPTRTKSYLKHKLISATAMLLISAIMMVSSSYAWYVLSTAPEVSNIKTQVGANGALEIALLNEDSWGNLDLLDMGDIDESLSEEEAASAAAAPGDLGSHLFGSWAGSGRPLSLWSLPFCRRRGSRSASVCRGHRATLWS